MQKAHTGERICGDVFVSRKVKEEGRTIVVLSDGLGHGVKANLLATLTATMALNFTKEHKDAKKIAEIIMNTLPVCSERKISYATFTIVDIERSGLTTILNYDNPDCVVMRGKELFKLKWITMSLDAKDQPGKAIRACSFDATKEDRIVLLSDGITQSGLGKGNYLLGWGQENVVQLIQDTVHDHIDMSATRLATFIVNRAHTNDGYHAKDDMSAVVIYFREPRRLLLISGPPFDKKKDTKLAGIVSGFKGLRIICGGTTADIIARELGKTIQDTLDFEDPELPPLSTMDGADLVSEGILTLSKVSQILERYDANTQLGKGPADRIIKMFLESDEIHLWVGTAVNIAHQDPSLPVELEIRRTVVKKIARILEDKLLKEVYLHFI